MANLPKLNNEINYLNIKDDNVYSKLHSIVEKYNGSTLEFLIKNIDFYDFKKETLEYVFKMVNTYPNSFYNICGPFEKKDDKWYIFNERKQDDKKIISDLRTENDFLRRQLNNIHL